ncbi:MAG: hypothetical protein H6713_05915 [Myxococcales bacterium]|nr:hypothetical protein [Myxococcales bacterium]
MTQRQAMQFLNHRLRLAALAGATLVAGLFALAPGEAAASVMGRQGVEIEGPNDRRGFFVGAGATFGASYLTIDQSVIPPLRADLVFGGGISKNFTLGINAYVGGYATSRPGSKVLFGGDIEGTGFLVKGLFLRVGLGGAGMPDSRGRLSAGLGGKAGIGYEFWLNSTAAMAIDLTYDIRYVPEDGLRHSALVGFRFLWY